MNSDLPNVILLTLDSLRFDRLGINGYEPGHTPALNQLFKSSVNFKNAFSHGCPTQFSYPSIFTSTLPLDGDGYNTGILTRDISVTEVLRDAGYWTIGLVGGAPTSQYYGYNRGFNNFHYLQDIRVFASTLWKSFVSHFNSRWRQGSISTTEYVDIVEPVIDRALETLIQMYSDRIDETLTNSIFLPSLLRHQDYGALRKYFKAEQEDFLSAPNNYVRKRVIGKNYDEVYPPLTRQGGSKRKKQAIKLFNKHAIRHEVKYRAGVASMSGAHVITNLCQYIDQAEQNRFFIWANILDIHDLNYSDRSLQVPPFGSPVREKIAKSGNHYQGARSYDYAVAYVDHQISRLQNHLKASGHAKDTLLLVLSDHGKPANHPRPDVDHVGEFFDEFIHVPLCMSHQDLSSRTIDSLTGLIDVPSMLIDLLGLNVPSSFQGRKSIDKPERSYISLENTGRGPCDLETKRLRLAFRTNNKKYILREKSAENNGSCEFESIYDLSQDPNEFKNIVQECAAGEEAKVFHKIAENRAANIRKRLAKN